MTLSEVQFELKAPKGQFNKFGHYAYRSTEDILKAVKPLLKKFGDDLSLSDEPVLVGDWHYIKAIAVFTDKDGKQTKSTGFARESATKKGMDESQITGTASSYARKYALNGLFLIDDTKDADTDEYHQQNNKHQSKAKNPQQKPSDTKDRLNKALNILAEEQNTTATEVKAALIEQYKKEPAYKEDPDRALLAGAKAMYKQLRDENKQQKVG